MRKNLNGNKGVPRLKRKNSKNKGSSFEREIAEVLKEITKKEFRRTFGSGAFKHKNRNLDESGDLKCEDEKFIFSIECKFYATVRHSNIMNGECSQLEEWTNQLVVDSDRVKKHGVMFFKSNRQPTFVLIYINKKYNHPMEKIIKFVLSRKVFTLYKRYYILPLWHFNCIPKELLFES